MALSSNWKALSSKLNEGKVSKPKPKQKPKGKFIKKIIKITSVEEPKAPKETTRLLTPLACALWEVDPNSEEFVVEGVSRSIPYSDERKKLAGKYIAIDCEFVGVGKEQVSALARVSLVNFFGVVLLDTYVKPNERVTDWRTWVSGVTPKHMAEAITTAEAQSKVKEILAHKTLIGHAVQNDLKSLQLTHPRSSTRDTSRFSEFRKESKGKAPSLKRLASQHLGVTIQEGEHSSVIDAQATMGLFRKFRKAIESEATIDRS